MYIWALQNSAERRSCEIFAFETNSTDISKGTSEKSLYKLIEWLFEDEVVVAAKFQFYWFFILFILNLFYVHCALYICTKFPKFTW